MPRVIAVWNNNNCIKRPFVSSLLARLICGSSCSAYLQRQPLSLLISSIFGSWPSDNLCLQLDHTVSYKAYNTPEVQGPNSIEKQGTDLTDLRLENGEFEFWVIFEDFWRHS